jgi:polar amino acid transport system substrate-binding protein
VRILAHLLLLTALLPSHAAIAGKSINLSTITWAPYADAKMPNQGIAMDIVQTAFKRAGYEPKIVFDQTGRTIEGTAIGIFDVAALLWKSPEREKELAFSEPYLVNKIRLIKRKDLNVRVTELSDLKGLLVGVTRGYAYGEEFDKAPYFLRVQNDHVIQNLLLLVGGRIDFVVGDKWVLIYQMLQFMPQSISAVELTRLPVTARGLRIAISRKHPDQKQILDDFNAAIRAMREDGSLQQIIDTQVDQILNTGLLTKAQLEEFRRW